MTKKLLLLFIGILSISTISYAQSKIDGEVTTNPDGITVFQGTKRISSYGHKFTFAYAKGDKILLKFSTEKDKKLKYIYLTPIEGGRRIWQQEKVASFNGVITIPKEGVYVFEFKAKGMGARNTTIEIIRKTGSQPNFNTAWLQYNTYTTKDVSFTVDSMLGYKPAVINKDTIKVFDQYLYQNVELYNLHKQILGQAGIHSSQAKGYPMAIDKNKVPKNGKLKGYTYSLSSNIGGAKHWVIADITVSVGAMFLSPAAGFAAHGAMALIGPQPGSEPVQYFMSNRKSDIEILREIYSPYNDGRKATNAAKEGIGNLVGLVSGDAKDAVKGTKVKEYHESDLSFNQKGKVTNMLIYSAKEPKASWFIMANPEYTQAKNVKLKGSAIYYAPTYKNVISKEYVYELETQKLEKTTKQYSKTVTFGSVK